VNRKTETIQLDIRELAHPRGSIRTSRRPSMFFAAVLLFSTVAVISQLLYAESRLSSEQRQQTFESLGVYP